MDQQRGGKEMNCPKRNENIDRIRREVHMKRKGILTEQYPSYPIAVNENFDFDGQKLIHSI